VNGDYKVLATSADGKRVIVEVDGHRYIVPKSQIAKARKAGSLSGEVAK